MSASGDRDRKSIVTEWISTSTPYLAPTSPGSPDAWQAEAAAAGHVGRHRLVSVGVQAASVGVAQRLGIEVGDPAVLRRRLVTLDDQPVEVSDSWYPLAIAEGTGLAADKPIRGGAIRLLADLGYTATRCVEDITVPGVSSDVGELLGLCEGEPVIELTRTSYTEAGLPFEVAVMAMSRTLAGNLRSLRYELAP